MSNLEYRKTQVPVSVREAELNSDTRAIEGYAAKFNEPSAILYERNVNNGKGFIEIIDPGAFNRTLVENPDIRALYNHNTDDVLGRTKSGTLSLTVDDIGLFFHVDVPPTTRGRDSIILVERGDIDGCSFGMLPIKDDIQMGPDGIAIRTLLDVELFEISPLVAFPAYESTEVHLRMKELQEPKVVSTPKLNLAKKKLELL